MNNGCIRTDLARQIENVAATFRRQWHLTNRHELDLNK